jgi:hypothetical protein
MLQKEVAMDTRLPQESIRARRVLKKCRKWWRHPSFDLIVIDTVLEVVSTLISLSGLGKKEPNQILTLVNTRSGEA